MHFQGADYAAQIPGIQLGGPSRVGKLEPLVDRHGAVPLRFFQHVPAELGLGRRGRDLPPFHQRPDVLAAAAGDDGQAAAVF